MDITARLEVIMSATLSLQEVFIKSEELFQFFY